ncbi:P-loop containing nucleoside triphosphate hydrolase protein [Coprinopsis sp. MPI-PUGE-AT-0042]|nr:P-loop containing nucleoside triphosphate hydrolase protein [Coprinopsis sp. MPI-PUGE-AT-0042]
MSTSVDSATSPEGTVEFNATSEIGVGLSEASLSRGRREMLDLVNRLHSTGVQVDIDLPQIAVIGNQSAGKSSLIESISGITLPRAAGTCTRCPTECRLSRSEVPWQCEVSLRFITDAKGQLLGQARNEPFGGVINDKTLVEDRIRRAQRAILNPGKPTKLFLDDKEELDFEDSLTFSNNCVSLKISGVDVADLSFVDLPGLIASVSTGRGHTNDVELVESLVTSYIKRPSCIVLLTVACETDFENQGAHRIAKKYDPEGKRTIGVLTKPDRIPTGEEANWLPFIRNEKETLEHNWFCVKQPSSNDLKQNLTWADARRREDEFFSMTSPWSELDSLYQKYLRTSNLVERLSSLLSDLISKRLPQIQEELDRAIIKARAALAALPAPPSDTPINEVSQRIFNFADDLRLRLVEGVPDADGLHQAIRPAHNEFRKAIRSTAPAFRPFEKRHAGKQFTQPTFLSHEEGPGAVEEGEQASVIYVDEVLKRAHEARTRELPGHVPFVVQQAYIEEIIKKWQEPMSLLLQEVKVILTRHVMDLVLKHFGDFGQGGLEQRVRISIQKHLNDCFERAEYSARWLLKLESRPFTLNTHYLADYRDQFISFYKAAREKETRGTISTQVDDYNRARKNFSLQGLKDPNLNPTGISRVLLGLTEIGLEGVKAKDICKLLPEDQMEPAIRIMADVRAYFQVAYKRFADNVPLAIDHELVCGIKQDILHILYSKLGLNGPDGHKICKELAQESPQVGDKRVDLQKKLERLQTASSQLLSVGTLGTS